MEEKKTKVWDNCELIGEVQKSERTKLRIELVARDGIKSINIREWYLKKSEGVWKPAITGFAVPLLIPTEQGRIAPAAELQKLVAEAIAKAPDFEIENEANAVWAVKKKRGSK